MNNYKISSRRDAVAQRILKFAFHPLRLCAFAKVYFLIFILLVPCLPLSAFDFGVFVNQDAGYGGAGNDSDFDYSIGVVPWIKGLIGENSDFIVTGGFEADFDKGWSFAPELLRTELSFHSGAWSVLAGRMYHSDPLGLIADGLFDGAKVAYNSEMGTFSAGAWYTGLLYKKRANIEITALESESLNSPLDYDDFANTYFAPKRFIAALGWEHLGGKVQARAKVLGQFDLYDEKPLNSQYAIVKFTMSLNDFSFDLGGCFELLQNDGDFGTAFAAEAGLAYALPTAFNDKLSLLVRYASGGDKDGKFAFTPITTVSQGEILEAKFSAITMLSLDYLARLHSSVSAGLTSSYFIRNGQASYAGYPLGENDNGNLLGNEFYARLIWSPASDLYINLGGGIFMPSLGNAAPKADGLWRVELKAVFALF